jgi:hypothetical protein
MSKPFTTPRQQVTYRRATVLLKSLFKRVGNGPAIAKDDIASWITGMNHEELDQFLMLTRRIDQAQPPSVPIDPLPASVATIFDHPGFAGFVDKSLTRQRS